jgi:hypothetical protein
VGLDSLGDYSLMYQNEKTANGIAEYIDNSHNFFLQFAATGGIILALYYLTIILISLLFKFNLCIIPMPFECKECGFFTILKANYERHLSTEKHKINIRKVPVVPEPIESTGLKCKHCDKIFSHKQSLNRHENHR